MLIALIVLGIVALACTAALVCGLFAQGRTIHKLGNQVAANSDYQVERIRIEEARHRTAEDAPHLNGQLSVGRERPDVIVPNRWGQPD